jgi:hypothetical protein
MLAPAGEGGRVRRLRRWCERRLDGIPVPRPFNLDEFCQGVARSRGRRLGLHGVPGLSATAPCGLWISTPSADYIFFEPNTSGLHSEHIVLHEVGHMLCDHSIAADVGSSALARLLPDLDPRTVSLVLGRVGYTNDQEREAEMLASIIRARSARAGAGWGSGQGAVGRLAHALSFEP